METDEKGRPPRRAVVAGWAYGYGTLCLMAAGVGGALLGWRPSAFLLVGYIVLQLAVHLALGTIGYRSLMEREWPKVRPLEDDDDW